MNIPREHINDIINHFINNTDLTSKIRVYNPNENDLTLLNDDCVLMVIEGRVSLAREKDDILMASFEGPYIIKICSLGVFKNMSLSQESNFSYITCRRSDFYHYIDEKKLWCSLVQIMKYSTWQLYSRIDMMTNGSVYDSVKFYLRQLNSNPSLRQKENVCQYIVVRTGYAKSGVMMILNELRKGKYISIVRGKLTECNKLPNKF
jgi:hypothetical protein